MKSRETKPSCGGGHANRPSIHRPLAQGPLQLTQTPSENLDTELKISVSPHIL